MVSIDTSALVSGPAKNQRLGLALGIDIGCMDLPLVFTRELSAPRASIIVTTAAQRIIKLSRDGDKVKSIVVASSTSDPTEHPEFKQITENLRDLRNKWFPRAKLCVVSDQVHLESAAVRSALRIYDRPMLSIEWGTTKTFTAMTKRKSTVLAPMVSHLKSLDQLIIQARFVRGTTDNTTDTEVKGWIKRLQEISPKEVQILAFKKTAHKGLRPAPKGKLEKIAALVTESTGIPTSIVNDEPVLHS